MHNLEKFTNNTPVDINDDGLGVKRVAYRGDEISFNDGLVRLVILICPKHSGGEICTDSAVYPPAKKVIRITDASKHTEYKDLFCNSGIEATSAKIIEDNLENL